MKRHGAAALASIAFLGALLGPHPVSAQAQWEVESAAVSFTIRNAGFLVGGRFDAPEVAIEFDPNNPGAARLRGSLAPATILTGIGMRDRHLQGRQYFDVRRYPRITMEAVEVAPSGEGGFIGIFRLQIRDIVRQVEVPFEFAPTAGGGRLRGSLTLDRLDYGLGEESLILSNEVTISVEIELRSIPAAT